MTGLLNPDGTDTAHTGPIPADATPENCPLAPAPGSVVVVRESPPSKTVHVPQHVREKQRSMMAECRVMAVGDHSYYACGEKWHAPCAVGDRVLTRGVSGFATHKQEGSKTIWEVLPFDAICSIVDKDSVPEIPEMRGIGGPG